MLFREIAKSIRGQIESLKSQPSRSFIYADDVNDRERHQRRFLKHFPKTAEVITSWLNNPTGQHAELVILQGIVLREIPESIPEDMRLSLALAIGRYVETSPFTATAPPGWFVAREGAWGPTGEEITCLAISEGLKGASIYTSFCDLPDVEKVASDLNTLSQSAWSSPSAQAFRELVQLDSKLREKLRENLGDIIDKPITRRHCDRECYELSSGD